MHMDVDIHIDLLKPFSLMGMKAAGVSQLYTICLLAVMNSKTNVEYCREHARLTGSDLTLSV